MHAQLTTFPDRAGMSTSLVWLFAIASGLSVANVYYAQPLLDALARDFSISQAAVGGVITATQIGCALALLFLVPLGDRVDRRRLMVMQMLALIVALAAVAMAQSAPVLLAGMLAVGLLGTAMTQGLIAYAASAAAPHEQGQVVGAAQGGVFIGLLLARVFSGGVSDLAGWRGLLAGMLAVGLLGTAMTQGLIAYAASAAAPREQGRVVGTAQGGVFIGLLLARVFSGGVSDLAGWRGVYFCAALLMLMIAIPLWRRLPVLPPASRALSYPRLLASMLMLLREEKVLQVRGMLALLMFAAFNIFWSALVLPLSAPPYGFSHTAIGVFGLAGVVGALAAARAGQWADRGYARRTSGMALLALLLAWWPLSLMEVSLWALVIGILILPSAVGWGRLAPPPRMPISAGRECACWEHRSACWRCCSGG